MDIDEPDSIKSVRLAPDEITDYVFIRECEVKGECQDEEPEPRKPEVVEEQKKEEKKEEKKLGKREEKR